MLLTEFVPIIASLEGTVPVLFFGNIGTLEKTGLYPGWYILSYQKHYLIPLILSFLCPQLNQTGTKLKNYDNINF